MNEQEIETLLRRVPVPVAPSDLRSVLVAEIQLPRAAHPATGTAPTVDLAGWWRRWVPAVSFGLLFLGCLMVLGVQTLQVIDLRRQNEQLQIATARLEELRRENAELQQLRSAGQGNALTAADQNELLKLRVELAELRGLSAELTRLQTENQRLQAALQAGGRGVVPENDPFAKAKEKANATACISNLKQIGLAARMWAHDHNTDLLPLDWLAIKTRLPTPKLLTCPSDTGRKPAISWEQFDGSSVSYELPSAAPAESQPYTVYSRCRVHGSIGLTDGSAHMKIDPERLQQVGGNLMLRNNATRGTRP